ncbi:hypothetical protein GCM10023145_28480 [Angustibacter luteus]
MFLVGALCVVVGFYQARQGSSETHPGDYLGIGAVLAFFGVGAMLAAVASAIDKVELLHRQLAVQPGQPSPTRRPAVADRADRLSGQRLAERLY